MGGCVAAVIVLLLCGPVLGVVALLLLGRLGLRGGAAKRREQDGASGEELAGKSEE